MATTVTHDTLNSSVEFECPFLVVGPNTIEPRPDAISPEVTIETDADGQYIGDPETWDGWEFVTGYSGQYRYSGPCMHSSEYLGGRMAQDVLDDVGAVYVVCAVYPLDGSEPESWVLLRKADQ